MSELTFTQARNYLYSLERFGWKLGLERIHQLLDALGHPERNCRCIHIAGTNGKGSVAAMLASVYKAAGYRTGLYTSPHLEDVRERVRINGDMIAESGFAAIMQRLMAICKETPATFFEVMTALAFEYFSQQGVEIVILETGLGGRFDATNVVIPELSVITTIDLDHTEHLGSDLASIAFEKAGIIKPGVPCLTGDLPPQAHQVIHQVCRERAAPLHSISDVLQLTNYKLLKTGTKIDIQLIKQGAMSIHVPLVGQHQAQNAALAVAATQSTSNFNVDVDAISKGLTTVRWEGRFQILRTEPPIVLDVAHNAASISGLVDVLQALYPDYRMRFMLGLLNDKDAASVCRLLAPLAESIMLVTPESDRAMDVEILKREFGLYDVPVEISPSIEYGLNVILHDSDPKRLNCITGSHFVAGKVKSQINSLTS